MHQELVPHVQVELVPHVQGASSTCTRN